MKKDEHDRPHKTSYYLQGSKKPNSPGVLTKRKYKTMNFIISMI